MIRSELFRAVQDRTGKPVPPHILEYLCQHGRLDPPPRLDGGHRRVFEPVHVDQVVAYVTRKQVTS